MNWIRMQLTWIRLALVGEWHRWVTIPLARWRDPVPKDEFDSSLDMDVPAMFRMTKRERRIYLDDLTWRRHLAHEQDFVAGDHQ